MSKKNILLIIVIAVVVVVVLIITLGGVLGPKEVVVPDVTGLAVEEAMGTLTGAGFSVVIETVPQVAHNEAANDEEPLYEEGKVISQDPASGTMAPTGSTVVLRVAGHPEEEEEDPNALGDPAEVPDVVGKTTAAAELDILNAGFRVGTISYENSDRPLDTVIRQLPIAGDMAPANSKINLAISLGQAEETINVPNLRGMTEQQAQTALQNAGLRYARGSNVDAKSMSEINTAVAQRPSANSVAKKGDTVTVDFGIGLTVTFINGANNSTIRVDTVYRGANLATSQYPQPPQVTGWTFANWSPPSLTNIQRNETVTANYSAQQFTVTVVRGTLTNGSTTGTFAVGATVNIMTAEEEKVGVIQTFVNWTSNPNVAFADAAQLGTSFIMPAGNVTVTANWKEEILVGPGPAN